MPAPEKKSKKKEVTQRKLTWEEQEESAFQELKQRSVEPPILGYLEFNQPFELHTDASTKGLGAILYQEQQGTKRVIAYASRGLTKAEQKYAAHKLEFLALKWAVCDKFKDYLIGQQFLLWFFI